MSPGTGTHAGLKGGRLQSPGRRSVGGSAQSSAAGLGWRRRRGHSWQPPGNITHTNEGEDEGEDVDVDACVDVEQAAAGRSRSRTQERQDVDMEGWLTGGWPG